MSKATLALLSLLVLVSCGIDSGPRITEYRGKAQGTSFYIAVVSDEANDFSADIQRILTDFDKSLSLWQEDSFISIANMSSDSLIEIPSEDNYFVPVFNKAIEVRHKTKGAFDPSIYPLVRAWGFGAIDPRSDSIPDINQLLKEHHVGDRTHIAEAGPSRFLARPVGMELDFNGIAQGYSVDVLCEFLDKEGIEDYMVEIGGELRTKGHQLLNRPWSVKIERPNSTIEHRQIQDSVLLSNKAIATSGSYRKFKERDGKRYSHCIDPRSGHPVQHTLLSVTVIANTCMEADAYATAFMVMGVEETLSHMHGALGKKLEVLMIYDEDGDNKTKGTGRFDES